MIHTIMNSYHFLSEIFPPSDKISHPLLLLFGAINSLIVVITCLHQEVSEITRRALCFCCGLLKRSNIGAKFRHPRELLKIQDQQGNRERSKDKRENGVVHILSPNAYG